MENAPSRQQDQGTGPGVRYVEEYLSPLLLARLGNRGRKLACVVIAPDDAKYDFRGKAAGLRRAGHECDVVVMPVGDPPADRRGDSATAPIELPLASNHYDLIELGEIGRIATGRGQRDGFARELARICRQDGALMMPIGNRLCPVNLSGGRLSIHGPWCRTLLSLKDAEDLFVGENKFSSVQTVNVAGHFGWSRIPGPARLAGRALDGFWRWIATPSRRWLYASPVNPVAVLWIEK